MVVLGPVRLTLRMSYLREKTKNKQQTEKMKNRRLRVAETRKRWIALFPSLDVRAPLLLRSPSLGLLAWAEAWESSSDSELSHLIFSLPCSRYNIEVKHIKIMTSEGLYRITEKKAFRGLLVRATAPTPTEAIQSA